MKLIIKIISLTALFIISIAAQPSYLMSLSNPQIIDDKNIEFDVNIKSNGQAFVLTSYQCVFDINSEFLNDSSFCFEYIPSSSQMKNSPIYGVGCVKIDGSRKIHFASGAGKDTIDNHSVKIGRFKIRKSSYLLIDSLNLKWSFTGIYKTIITGENFEEITNPAEHTNLSFKYTAVSPKNYLLLNAEDGTIDGNIHLTSKNGSLAKNVVYFLNSYSTLTFSVTINKSGDWYAWGRMFFDSTKQLNSFYFQIDGGSKLTFGNKDYYNQWHWEGAGSNKLPIGNLTQGEHTITIYGREPAETVLLDQILLTSDENLAASDELFENSTPVELVSFSASLKVNNQIELHWVTSTELNNFGFYIERSTDKSKWENIGFIKGNGTTSNSNTYKFWDNNISPRIYYRIKQVDNDGTYSLSSIVEVENKVKEFNLSQNYPNPFNPSTHIQYSINKESKIHLVVCNLLGEQVRELNNNTQSPGNYIIEWNASNYASGAYLLVLTANPTDGSQPFKQIKKMLLLK